LAKNPLHFGDEYLHPQVTCHETVVQEFPPSRRRALQQPEVVGGEHGNPYALRQIRCSSCDLAVHLETAGAADRQLCFDQQWAARVVRLSPYDGTLGADPHQ
jgi:hypothetical protein